MSNKSQPYCQECPYLNQKMFTFHKFWHYDLLIIGTSPTEIECRLGFPTSRENRAVTGAIAKINSKLKTAFIFAVGCCPTDSATAEDIYRCAPRLKDDIALYRAKVLLILGSDAAKAFGIKEPVKKIRGLIYDLDIDGHKVKAICTYSANTFYKSPGLISVLNTDVNKAINLCRGEEKKADYNLEAFTTYEEIISALKMAQTKIAACNKKLLVAVDTETTSLEPHRSEERVIAVSLSWAKDQGMAFLLDHREAGFSSEQIRRIVHCLEKTLDPEKVVTCAANAKFDYKWLRYRYGLDIPFFNFDVMLAEHILDEDKKGEYGLKNMTRDYFPELAGYDQELEKHLNLLQLEAKKEQLQVIEKNLPEHFDKWLVLTDQERAEIIGNDNSLYQIQKTNKGAVSKRYKNRVLKALKEYQSEQLSFKIPELKTITYEDLPVPLLLEYAAIDAMVTRKIFTKQYGNMQDKDESGPTLFEAFTTETMPLCEKIAEMEYLGVKIDRDKAGQYIEIMDESLTRYRNNLYQAIGREFNLSSSAPDLKKILFQEKKYEPVKLTDTGEPSTDAESIEKLYQEHQKPFLKDLLAHRKIEKARNTYVLKWLDMSEYNGRLNFNLHQNQTATYRLSSSNPSLQNVPFQLKEANLNLKALFIPDSEDMEFYDLDIANAEMRVLCAYSKDETLIDAFNQGMDIHSLTAAGISDYSYEEIMEYKEDKTTEQYQVRQMGKRINFGTIYSMGARTLGFDLGISEEEAQNYLDKFFEKYPGVKKYMQETRSFAFKHRYVYTFTGRRRKLPLLGSDIYHQSRAYRQAINARIQTTAADIVNANIVELYNQIKPIGGRVILTVHDSILFQLPKGTPGVKELLDYVVIERTRKRFPWLPVSWKYDVGRGPNYGECKYPIGP